VTLFVFIVLAAASENTVSASNLSVTGREIDWIMREEETGDIYSLVQSGASLTLELVANQSGER
jgi:hypothetical protein